MDTPQPSIATQAGAQRDVPLRLLGSSGGDAGEDDGAVDIDLDALHKPVGHVRLNGRRVPVFNLDGVIVQAVSKVLRSPDGERDGDRLMQLYYDGCARMMPSVPRAEIDVLDPTQVAAIIGLGLRSVGRVETVLGNASGDGSRTAVREAPSPPSSSSSSTEHGGVPKG